MFLLSMYNSSQMQNSRPIVHIISILAVLYEGFPHLWSHGNRAGTSLSAQLLLIFVSSILLCLWKLSLSSRLLLLMPDLDLGKVLIDSEPEHLLRSQNRPWAKFFFDRKRRSIKTLLLIQRSFPPSALLDVFLLRIWLYLASDWPEYWPLIG